jgi:hypothetical protein
VPDDWRDAAHLGTVPAERFGLVHVRPLDMLLRFRRSRSALTRLAAGLSLTSLGIAVLPHGDAQAIVAGCRSDPIILVNGDLADIVSTLNVNASAIKELDYTVRVSPGALTGIIRLTVGLGFPEKVTYVFDPSVPWGIIELQASVVTQPGVAPFPTTVSISTLFGHAATSGLSNAIVPVSVANQLML